MDSTRKAEYRGKEEGKKKGELERGERKIRSEKTANWRVRRRTTLLDWRVTHTRLERWNEKVGHMVRFTRVFQGHSYSYTTSMSCPSCLPFLVFVPTQFYQK